ncbi:hypothetical protein ACH9EU_00770 [Kocuria sp. M1R5S2]|uniref:mycothiol-dependent nitroreductase Rv2466c family protein n=1 Tax=Kocuria rhizosphaerae TaxID=3376285 RepID=UPI0037A21BAD
MKNPDIRFWFDPTCPFAWLAARWVRTVSRHREYSVEWRFISLRILNEDVDYNAWFPPEYEAGHTAGLRLLRVAARTRAEHGPEAVDRLYAAIGAHSFDADPVPDEPGTDRRGTRAFLEPVLSAADLPAGLADALDDDALDAVVRAETEEALALTGKDVGTPIIHFEPPGGTAFFGPVISRLPAEEDAVQLWDHVVGLARFPGFAELKRSLREQPQLRGLGAEPGGTGAEEDWHAGSRRTKN